MDLRKTLTLCLALLLVVGFANQADALEGDPSGWGVAVSSPDSAGWAGIGDSVIVTVKRTTTIGDSALTVFVGLYTATDTVSAAEVAAVPTANTATLLASAGGTGVAGSGTFDSNNFISAALVAPTSSASGIQTYRFAFGVDAGDAEADDRVALRAQAFIDHGSVGASEWKQLTSTSVASQFDVAGSSLNVTVGDQDRFGIDGQRPDNTKISAVSLTLPDIFKIVATDTTWSAGIGDALTANIEVSGVGSQISRADVYVQDVADPTAVPDSAFATYSFDLLDLVAGPATKELTLAAGSKPSALAITATQRIKFPDGQRVIAVAHLVDRAGNVSSTNVNDATAVGFSDNTIVYVVDTTVPVITLTNPDSSIDFVTANIDTTVSMIQSGSPATAADVTFAANPIEWKVSEGTNSRFVTDGTDTAFADSAASSTAAKKFYTKGVFSDALGEADGFVADFVFAATDSSGNKVTKSISGIPYDEVAPGITVFPSNASLGQTSSGPDTMNAASAQNPVVNYTETADSISIRYVEVGGAAPSDKVVQAVADNKLGLSGDDVQVVVQDTFLDGSVYSLQVLIIDKAGNANVTLTDTLLYDKQFENPATDSFKVIAAGPTSIDSQLVGADFTINITAIDSAKNRLADGGNGGKAVTYKTDGVKVLVTLAEADAAKLGQVKLSGTGVDTTGLYGTGMAVLDADGWALGGRAVKVKSNLTLDGFMVSVSDTSGGISRVGETNALYMDAEQMEKYAVTATEDGVAAEGVSGEFGIWVVPTDEFGNASMKNASALDTRTTALKEIFAEISSNKAQVSVPQGPQPIILAGSAFTGFSNASGDGLVISVLTSSVQGDTSGASNTQLSANGKSASLAFAGEGEEPVVAGAPAAPDSLIVQDYLGADGEGDQGGFVLVSFPNSEDHAAVSTYRLYREVSVTTGLDSLGNLTILDEAVDQWISWVTIDAAPVLDGADAITQAVVPTLDGARTSYAIAAEKGNSTSDATAAGKRVFTKANVQQMVKLLGVDPNRVYSHEELSELFTPSADYVKSIIGDQNLQFASLDPDIASLVGNSTVPQSIRTDGAEILSSQKTLAAGPVKAVDNIPPSAVTEAALTSADGTIEISWTPSIDDRVVAYSSYRGFAIPIAGVDHYEIYSIAGETATLVGESPSGSSAFTVEVPATGIDFYRVDALDLDNVALGTPIEAIGGSSRIPYADGEGNPIFIIITSGATTPFRVDFEDFLGFVGAFGSRLGDDKYDVQSDLNDDDIVNFDDFLLFAGSFNDTAVTRSGSPVPSTKPVISPAGQNGGVILSLDLKEDKVLPGQLITVDVSMASVEAMLGFGFTLNYDDTKFEFVEAGPASEDLLKTGGAETPVFLQHAQNGSVTVANAMNDVPVGGEGQVVSLTFKVLSDFEDAGRFDIADAIVFDGNLNSNPVVVLPTLELQTTPTEFALLQNYPNPFNPETTIKYNLAEGAGVSLRIYNIVGQVVRTLVAENQTAGRYQVRWDGTDDRGSSVSSGIYFYQVAAGQFKDVKRLMLLK